MTDVNPAMERQMPLAIIGLSCLFPKAANRDEFWANIRNGVDAITEIPPTHWSPDDYFSADPKAPDMTYARRGGFLSPVEFDPMEFGISPANLEAIDTSQLLGLVAAKRALEDAGYGADRPFDRSRVGCVLGVTGTLELVIPLGARLGHPHWRRALKEAGVSDAVAEDVIQRISDSYVPWQENSFPGLLGNVVAGRIANRLDLGGTNCVVDAACASSLSALHLAALELTTGRSDMVLTGGVDTFNDIFMYLCFSKTPALSPTGNAKPFSSDADGTILGEGVGMLVLKRLADAQRDGDRVYAVIRGIGASSDGKGNAVYAPKADGQVRCVREAYRVAGVTPDTIELVEAHGTGTKVGDATEAVGLAQVFGQADRARPWCALGSVKSQIGHTKAAAGVAGIIKATLALTHRVLPPTIKVTQPTDALADPHSPFYVNTEPRPWLANSSHPRRAAVSAFGFGGSNFHCVLEEASHAQPQPDWSGDVQILSFSAPTVEELQRQLASFNIPVVRVAGAGPKGSPGLVTAGASQSLQPRPPGDAGIAPPDFDWSELRALAGQSRRRFEATHECRLHVVIERDHGDLSKTLTEARSMLERHPHKTSWSTPDGVHFGRGEKPGRLGFVFPGQGSQYVGMLRDLACHFPRMQDILREADAVFCEFDEGKSARRLSDHIYPPSVFRDEDRAANEQRLRATDVAQPAIGAVSLGALAILEQFGVTPQAVAGHSYGELTALCASGRFEPAVLYRLSKLRGRLMAETSGDEGAMLALSAPADLIERALFEEAFDLVIANRNSPSQVVLSGRCVEIDKAAESFARRNIRGKRLQVAAAFHSPLVAGASERFRPYLDEVEFAAPVVPVFANTSAREYPADPVESRNLLARQLAQPVDWVREIENMYEAGVRTFVEVGPGTVLAGLIGSILHGREHKAIALDASSGKRSGMVDLAHALAQLSALGYDVDLAAWDPSAIHATSERKPRGLTVPICGANYVKPRERREGVRGRESEVREEEVRGQRSEISEEIAERESDPRLAATRQRIAAANDAPAVTTPEQRPRTTDPTPPNHLVEQGGNERVRTAAPNNVADACRATHEHLLALQRMQEQTARLHQQFLQGQETALRTFQSLADQQHALLTGTASAAIPSGPSAVQSVPSPALQLQPVMPASVDNGATSSRRTGDLNGQHSERDVVSGTEYPGLGTQYPISSPPRSTLPPALSVAEPPRPQASLDAEPVSQASAATAAASKDLAAILLQVVSEKTGYPAEMLTLEMSLDHDLGVDSIKRVEILSALQERLPDAPTVSPEQLGTLHTLRDVVAILESSPLAPQVDDATRGASRPQTATTELANVVLQVVAEKTGYPAEMLQLDMSLDNDLGVDSIKRVEILSALQERLPDAPAVKPEELGTLQTLRDVVATLESSPLAPRVEDATGGASQTQPPSEDLAAILLQVVSEKTGYPADILRLDMGLDHDLGVDSIKRVEILSALQERLPDAPVAQPEQLGTLHTLRDILEFLSTTANSRLAATRQRSALAEVTGLTRGVVQPVPLPPVERPSVRLQPGAVIWVTDDGSDLSQDIVRRLQSRGNQPRLVQLREVPPMSIPTDLCGLVLIAPSRGTTDDDLQHAFRWLQAAGPRLRDAAKTTGTLFVTVSRLDGCFGFETNQQLRDVLSGGLAGLAKTVRHEWPEVRCKAIDLAEDWDSPVTAAEAVVDEMLSLGSIEVGLSARRRVALTVRAAALGEERQASPLQPGDLVLISGGARGVTAEAAFALANAFHPTLAILGRSPEPEPEPDWLARLTTESDIKRALLTHAAPGTTPKAIEQEYRRVLANREVRDNLARLRATGAQVIYTSVDVRDAEQVRSLVESLTRQWGPVRGIVHGAGVLADQRIEDKTPEQFERVYSTKIAGLRSLLQAVPPDEPRCLVLFSSFTGRYGRTGQIDYAVANEVLNKLAQQHARANPQCRTVAFNWGPWEGGMVTPALKKLFAAEGIGLIPLAAGAELLVRELEQPAGPAEVLVIGGDLPAIDALPTPIQSEPVRSDDDFSSSDVAGPSIVPADFKLAFERTLDAERSPFLKSHVIGGKAVLPMAVVLEWLAHGALHGNPGLELAGLDELRIFKGVRVGMDDSIPIRVLAGKATRRDHAFVVTVKLFGQDNGRDVPHAGADVILAAKLPPAPKSELHVGTQPWPHPLDVVYRDLLFHGPELQGIEQIEACAKEGIAGVVRTAPLPAQWVREPLRGLWLTDPLVLDSAFQLMTLWCREVHGVPSLPTRIGRYRQFRRGYPKDGARVIARVTHQSRNQAAADLEILDRQGGLIARIENYECVLDGSLTEAFRRNRL